MLVCALLASETAHAQSWPQRPVKFVLPLGPGSGTDIGARLISDRLAARWGQPVVIENRPGGDGMVAISAFVGARDDHVLLFSPSSSFTAHPYLHENLPYKPSDLAPIARFSNTIISIAVPRSLRLDTLAQLFELARAQPGKLNWAGTTGATDFIFAGLAKRAGAEMTKVPYRNPVEAANDLGEARVQAYASALAIVRPQLEAGKIRLLAVYNSVRAPTAPDIPTVAEAGFPEMTMDGLVGLFGPPEMPLDLRERIAGDVQAVSDASVAERLLTTGQILNTGGPAEFDAAVEEQRAKIAAIAKELAIKPGQ
jgi:tripartite-type tricarboxylate transporter receptor subunit TctC